jgi:hypothetical protein
VGDGRPDSKIALRASRKRKRKRRRESALCHEAHHLRPSQLGFNFPEWIQDLDYDRDRLESTRYQVHLALLILEGKRVHSR